MTALFYYFYLSGLSKDELREIDRLVDSNRKIFVIVSIISGTLLFKSSTNANEDFLPGVNGLKPQTPITRPARPESFGTKTATGVG